MKPLYTQEEFKIAKPNDFLSCECYKCQTPFKIRKNKIIYALRDETAYMGKFCSNNCYKTQLTTKQKVNCTNCNFEFEKRPSQIKITNNNFCTKSCSATYNNKNKTHGTKRSKLEIWLEEQLTILYPELLIHFNKKSAIGSELDIYIPSLNLAFELNGIFHYEPIYGVNKLNQIQSNDKNKFQLCIKNKIDLCIIDASNQKYFKPSTSQKYLDIIISIINERI